MFPWQLLILSMTRHGVQSLSCCCAGRGVCEAISLQEKLYTLNMGLGRS